MTTDKDVKLAKSLIINSLPPTSDGDFAYKMRLFTTLISDVRNEALEELVKDIDNAARGIGYMLTTCQPQSSTLHSNIVGARRFSRTS